MRKWSGSAGCLKSTRTRNLCCIQNMRMFCNSTFLFDKQTHHSPKLQEVREVIRELAIEENRKVGQYSASMSG